MKAGIHPEIKTTKVTCLGCGNTFESTSTVDEINVDVCNKCHPFYTGKQKLVDTAGRVDRFRAQAEAAKARKEALGKKAAKATARKQAKIAKNETITAEAPKSKAQKGEKPSEEAPKTEQ